MSIFSLRHIDSDQDFQACFSVMRELRPHLTDTVAFTAQARRQATQRYRLLAAWQNHEVKGLAGYRFQENLLYGRFLYVDDLVVLPDALRSGLESQLIDAMLEEAQFEGCVHFVLDTNLKDSLEQHPYFPQSLLTKGVHFCQSLLTAPHQWA